MPRRWEPVVFVSPEDEGSLVVKRVVGLPGETVQLRDGEVWIDGQPARKTFAEQQSLHQLVHKETTLAQRWHGDGWSWNGEGWNCDSQENWQWLSYRHLDEKPVTDDSAYNAGLSRRLFAVNDLSLAVNLKTVGRGELAIRLPVREQEWEIRLLPATGKLELHSDGIYWSSKELSPSATKFLQEGEVQFEISTCGQQLLVAIEGRVEFTFELKWGKEVIEKHSRPLFMIGARDLSVRLQELRIYRDAYYASREEAASLDEPMAPVTLGEQELFVLGDNVPVSVDSRHWGPLPVRFLVGRPLGVR